MMYRRLGLCQRHYSAHRRHGGALPPGAPRGEAAPNWRGPAIGYRAAHLRVTAVRGPARLHECMACAGPASEWALSSAADPARLRRGPNRLAYSTEASDYLPMCARCHRRMDRARARARANLAASDLLPGLDWSALVEAPSISTLTRKDDHR